jgi:hypothetical protein
MKYITSIFNLFLLFFFCFYGSKSNAQSCINITQPAPFSFGTNTLSAGSCGVGGANNDAMIDFINITGADKADKSEGGTYTGVVYTAATGTISSGALSFTGLKHNTAYTFRIFNGADGCFKDTSITTPSKVCCAIPTTIAYTQTVGTLELPLMMRKLILQVSLAQTKPTK